MKTVILDGYNLIYRARYSVPKWRKPSEHSIVYSFFRSLRPLIEKLEADYVYFVLEGHPKMRMEAAPDYKGTRKYEKDESFGRQRKDIINLLLESFPVEVIRHPDYECDDVIAYLVDYHQHDECVVVSTDTDFLQLYNNYPNFKLYNPIKKDYSPAPGLDYVVWKSLRGDSADNISGFPGIGDKRAKVLTENSEKLEEFLDGESGRREKFEHNKFMISFHDLSQETNFERNVPSSNWSQVKEVFEKMQFSSIINDKSWDKFVNTFKYLEG